MIDHPGHRTLFHVDRCVSDSLESHSSGSLRLATDDSPNGTNSTACGSNCSVVSVDDVIGCPSSLQPVRVVVEENSSAAKRSRKRAVQHLPPAAQQQHRTSCMFSFYHTALACWSDWTRDPNFTSRFFFQDSRPVRFTILALTHLILWMGCFPAWKLQCAVVVLIASMPARLLHNDQYQYSHNQLANSLGNFYRGFCFFRHACTQARAFAVHSYM